MQLGLNPVSRVVKILRFFLEIITVALKELDGILMQLISNLVLLLPGDRTHAELVSNSARAI
jgi:hypothetical protein